MQLLEFAKDEEIVEIEAKYTPEKIEKIIETWLMVAETCGKDRKELAKHRKLFREIQDLTQDLGRYAMSKVMGNFPENEGEKDFVIGDRQYKAMEKHIKLFGVPEKYCPNMIDSFITTLVEDPKEIEKMIFGEYLEEEE